MNSRVLIIDPGKKISNFLVVDDNTGLPISFHTMNINPESSFLIDNLGKIDRIFIEGQGNFCHALTLIEGIIIGALKATYPEAPLKILSSKLVPNVFRIHGKKNRKDRINMAKEYIRRIVGGEISTEFFPDNDHFADCYLMFLASGFFQRHIKELERPVPISTT